MQFSQEHNNSAHVIKSYDDRSIKIIRPITEEMLIEADYEPDKVNDLRPITLTKSAVLCIDTLTLDWPPQAGDELKPEHFDAILDMKPEIVLIGTGNQLKWPKPHIMQPLIERGIGFEIMSTPAACRTYNVLMHEGRRIVAGLMLKAPD